MTDETLCVTGCGRPTTSYLCSGCKAKVRHTLHDLPGMIAELTTTAAKQTATQRSEGGGSKKAAYEIPFSWDAADLQWAAENTLKTWARHIHESLYAPLTTLSGPVCSSCFHSSCSLLRTREEVALPDEKKVPRFVAALCGWLSARVDWMSHRQEAGQFYDEITSLLPFSRRAVDTRADRYAGPCTFVVRRVVIDWLPDDNGDLQPTVTEGDAFECGADLRTHSGQKAIRCTNCGAEYDPAALMARNLEKCLDELGTAAFVAAALTDMGYPINRKTLNKWAQRTREAEPGTEQHPIAAYQDNAAGDPLYRVGDVLARIRASQPERLTA